MKQPMAFRAAFSDMKLVKTRQVAQLIFEIPLADFDAAYEVLGGLPDSSKERWFGIAALQASAALEKPKREWRDVTPTEQACIRSGDAVFGKFLTEQYPEDFREAVDIADCVRLICGVSSRAELNTNQKARMLWKALDEEFLAWKYVDA